MKRHVVIGISVTIGLSLMVGLVVMSKSTINPKEAEPTAEVTETSTEDLNIKISPAKNSITVFKENEDGAFEVEETIVIETQSLQEQKETLEAGDLIEKARANQESLEESKEESRAEVNETLSQQEITDNEVLSDEEIIRLHEEFQSEIDDFNMKEYERMMAEWESKKGVE